MVTQAEWLMKHADLIVRLAKECASISQCDCLLLGEDERPCRGCVVYSAVKELPQDEGTN